MNQQPQTPEAVSPAARRRRPRYGVRAAVGAIAVAALALAGCSGAGGGPGSSGGSTPVSGGTLRVGAVKPSTAVDPITMADGSSIIVVQQVAQYLVNVVGSKSTLEPQLAASWTSDAKAQNWTFTLRQGVKFNTGQPMTAQDVVASFNRVLDPKNSSGALTNFEGTLGQGKVEAAGDDTVVFHLDRPYADFPYLVSPANFNTVILPANYSGDWLKNPVGTGPYTLTNYQAAQRASLKLRNDYWGQKPYLAQIDVTYYSDPKAEALALTGGAVDMAIDVDSSLYRNPSVNVIAGPSAGYLALNMQVTQKPFNDVRVRQAVALCIDRQGALQGVTQGKGTIANDHLWSQIYSIQPQGIPQRTRDIDQAKTLLAQAGYPHGFTATLTIDDEPGVPDYAALIKQNCAPAGINIDIKQLSSNAFYGTGSNTPWLQEPFTIVTWGTRPVPEQLIEASLITKGVWNSSRFSNPQFDALLAQYDATIDPAKRQQIATQAAKILHDQVPVVVAFFQDFTQATNKNVHGITPSPIGNIVLTSAWISH
ncbi:ABC transporter substrate-binding protein [Planotetraspora sp. A-T 1434]|uniref:ABC transporter substrate-binding protein n=1 Tax=Planotetraspora sp. A-T 1434 TaxID=2979219 RepID=UPI0021BEBE5E|nr:ABC transporter substrate-binding protein [Planotetraspora sp. A-T 1434]MCT9934178.1 ABC transporter substrate-binding protein [Planotetraspora sp. A-T 1434]